MLRQHGASGPSRATTTNPLQVHGDVSPVRSPPGSPPGSPPRRIEVVMPSRPPRSPIHGPPLPPRSPSPSSSSSPSPSPSHSTPPARTKAVNPRPQLKRMSTPEPSPSSSSSSSPSLPPMRVSGQIRTAVKKKMPTPTKHVQKRRRVEDSPRTQVAGRPLETLSSAAPVTPTASRSRNTVAPLLAMFPLASNICAAPWMPESFWERDTKVLICFSHAAYYSKHYLSGGCSIGC
jgi:hypothetical protein